MSALLCGTGLSVTLGGRLVVSDVSLTLTAGELVVVVGPNGAGKTTLIRAIAGLVSLSAGSVTLGDDPLIRLPLAERARRVAYLPQGHSVYWPLPAADVVALGRLPRGAGADLSDEDRLAVVRAMAATGTTPYAARPVTTLSGGERARVAIARVLATEAAVILADEPTASLDPRYQLTVMDILRRHCRDGGAVLAVLHDLGLAARTADRLLLLDGGGLVAEGAPRSVLDADRLAKVFGIRAALSEIEGLPVVLPVALTDP